MLKIDGMVALSGGVGRPATWLYGCTSPAKYTEFNLTTTTSNPTKLCRSQVVRVTWIKKNKSLYQV